MKISGKPAASVAVAVIAIGLVTVGGAGTAVAAAHYLKLGVANSTDATTTLSTSSGSALSLVAPKKQPALKVSNKVRIPKLNASYLGGAPASAFATPGQVLAARAHFRTVVAAMSSGGGVARCPTGWHPSGGGVLPTTAQGATPPYIAVSSASVSNGTEDGWIGAAVGNAQYTGGGFVWVSCTDAPYASATAGGGAPAVAQGQTTRQTLSSARAAFRASHDR